MRGLVPDPLPLISKAALGLPLLAPDLFLLLQFGPGSGKPSGPIWAFAL